MAVHVRPITAADHDRWRELFLAYGVFYETAFSEDVLEGVWSWLMDAQHPVTAFVAVAETAGADTTGDLAGTIVGFAHFRSQPDTFVAGPGWYLDDLYTDPDARGTGAASSLIAAIEVHARAHGGGTLRWITADDNTVAQRVYDRLATRTSWVTYEKEI